MSAQSKTSSSGEQTLEARLAQHPELKAKIESLLSVVENAEGTLTQANVAEEQVIKEIRAMGQAALGSWAEKAQESASARFIQEQPKAHRSRKKNSIGTVD